MSEEKKFYRYEYTHYANGTLSIYPVEYVELRETDKGYWIIDSNLKTYPDSIKENYKKWIPKEFKKKRFAYDTKEEAWENLTMRTRAYIKILENKLGLARRVKFEIKRMNEKESQAKHENSFPVS